ncbi:hypothetical protein LTA6_002306 [Microbacterium sp. LTA6]
MAIAAADITFRDLLCDARDAESVAYELHDAVSLVGAWSVVEIQNSEVGRSAINAWVIDQVLGDVGETHRLLCNGSRADHCDVMLAIALVVAP